MKIAVIGAGPAGLYFAVSAKQKSPSLDLVVIEKGSALCEEGLGYVFQQPHFNLLYDIDTNVIQNISDLIKDPWTLAEIGSSEIITYFRTRR